MPKRLLHRRGTTAQTAVFTGGQGEFTMDTDKKVLVVHDGATAGGFPHARADQVLAVANNLSDLNNAATARTNLSVFSKLDSNSNAKVRSQGAGIYFPGSSIAYRIFAALSGYSIADEEVSVRFVFRVHTGTGTARTLWLISSSSSAVAANALSAHITSGGALEVRLYGASTSDYSYAQVNSFVSTYGGKVIELLVVRSYSGLAVYVNGEAVTVAVTGSQGTAPGWLGSITSTYFVVGSGVTSTSTMQGELYAASVFNYALSAAQALTLSVEGIPVSDQWGGLTDLITNAVDRDFSGANNWTDSGMASFDATTDLSVTSDVMGDMAVLDSANLGAFTFGARYKIVCDVANLSGTFYWALNTVADFGTISANGKHTSNLVVNSLAVGADLHLVANGVGSVDIDNISIKRAGAILDLNFNDASTYFIPDRSDRKFDALSYVSAIPWLLRSRRSAWIRGRTNTNGNQQLLGQASMPTNARITGIVINSDNSGTPTTTVSIGTASGGAQIANAVAVASGRTDVGTFVSRLASSGSIWIAADGTSNLDITIFFDLVE